MLSLLMVLAVFLAPATSRLTVIDASAEECFLEQATSGAEVEFLFDVVDGGFYDIDVKVMRPDNIVIHTVERGSSGNYTFTVPKDGEYKFCFSNIHTISKLINFSISIKQDVKKEEMIPANWSQVNQTDLLPSQMEVMAVVLRMEAAFNQRVRSLEERVSELEKSIKTIKTGTHRSTTVLVEEEEEK